MIDVPAAIREVLLADAGLVAKVGDRIYLQRLPEGHDFDQQAVVFAIQGGTTDVYVPHLYPTLEFKCWGKDTIDAQETYRLTYDALHDKSRASVSSGFLVEALEQRHGQNLIDPDSKRPYVRAIFRAILRKD
ncbi:hypothetical protein LCGC14_1395060 [marine sediment metagenome]|uniref:Uncharacterized protein n=1 Tax=marine sediment metagenome TaxID=412755 RepID=A0A0F9N0C2_9ZZZZ